jgi:hypothetical protein
MIVTQKKLIKLIIGGIILTLILITSGLIYLF